MNGRERIEAAFSPEGADEIPVVICYEDLFIRDCWSQLGAGPWWVRYLPDLEGQVAWRRQVAEAIGQDWFYVPWGASRQERASLSIEERDGAVYMVDRRTGRVRQIEPPRVGGWTGHGVASVRPAHPPRTPDEIDAWMEGLGSIEGALADGRADLPRRILSGWGAALYPYQYVFAPLGACYRIWGFEGMMLQLVDRPDLVRYAVECLAEYALCCVRVLALLGVRGVWIEDCLTDMVSLEHFRAFNLPYLRQIAAEVRACGMHSIHYFCGDPAGKWEALLDTGAHALSLEESKKGFRIDIADVVARVGGRMVVLGNLDAVGVLEQGSEEELRAEIARQIAAGRRNGGRFIMSLGSPVTPGTPVSRVRLYCDLAHQGK